MAVQSRDRKPRKGESKRTEYKTHRTLWRLNGARDGSWQTVTVGTTSGHLKQAVALDGWLRDVHGYAMHADDPRIAEFLGRGTTDDAADDEGDLATVADLIRAWIERPGMATATRVAYRSSVLNKLGSLGDMKAAMVTRAHVNRWFTAWEREGLASHTMARLEYTLKGALRGHVAADVFNDVSYAKRAERNVRINVLDLEQVAALLDAADGTHLYLPLWFMAETGVRYGEMAGLSAGDIDLAERTVHISRQLGQGARRLDGFNPTRLKSKRSRREIPISDDLADALAIAASLPHDAAVFSPTYAEHWHYDGFQKQFRKLVRRVEGVPDDLRLHDLRHTAAMRWLRAEPPVPLPVVSRLLGHSSVGVTDSTYSHWGTNDRAAILAAGLR